jgi:hypothetical protein
VTKVYPWFFRVATLIGVIEMVVAALVPARLGLGFIGIALFMAGLALELLGHAMEQTRILLSTHQAIVSFLEHSRALEQLEREHLRDLGL